MSEEKGFFSRILGGDTSEDETRVYPAEEIGARRPRREEPEERPQRFTVERAAEIIDDLPPDVPRESAVRIVRGTLKAAGVKVEDLERSTRARKSKFSSEIEQARNRQKELREKTDEVVRSLEEEIRKAREARDTGIAEEEKLVSRMSAGLKNIKQVRDFFGFPEIEEAAESAEEPTGDETRVLESFDADETQVLRRPGPLADDTSGSTDATPENPSYRDPYGTADER